MHVKNKQANKQKKQQSNKQCVWTFENMGGGWVAGWLLGGLDDKFAEPPPHSLTIVFLSKYFQYNHVKILRVLENDMQKCLF